MWVDGGDRPSAYTSWVFVTVAPGPELWEALGDAVVEGASNWVVVPLPSGTSHAVLRQEAEDLSMKVRDRYEGA